MRRTVQLIGSWPFTGMASEGATYREPAPARAGNTTCERPHRNRSPRPVSNAFRRAPGPSNGRFYRASVLSTATPPEGSVPPIAGDLLDEHRPSSVGGGHRSSLVVLLRRDDPSTSVLVLVATVSEFVECVGIRSRTAAPRTAVGLRAILDMLLAARLVEHLVDVGSRRGVICRAPERESRGVPQFLPSMN